MFPLWFDESADGIIHHRLAKRPDAVLRLEILPSYSRGGSYHLLTLTWTSRSRAECDRGLIRWDGPHGVPLFIVPRLSRYLAWHPLHVHGLRLGPFRRLIPAGGPLFVVNLRAWEQTHPIVNVSELPAA